MNRRRARAVLVLGPLVMAACGVATDDPVQVADPGEVPFGLLDADRVPAALPAARDVPIEVHMFEPTSGRLVPVPRAVTAATTGAVAAELEGGPTDAESAAGLQSALTDLDVFVEVAAQHGTAVVDLDASFLQLNGSDQLVALAQIVFTLTQLDAIDRVAILVDGASVQVPRGDGTLTRDALSREDYASFAPR